MQKAEFTPDGITYLHSDSHTESELIRCLFWKMSVTGPGGAHFLLLREAQHTPEDVQRAKMYLRSQHDVVSLHVVSSTEVILKTPKFY